MVEITDLILQHTIVSLNTIFSGFDSFNMCHRTHLFNEICFVDDFRFWSYALNIRSRQQDGGLKFQELKQPSLPFSIRTARVFYILDKAEELMEHLQKPEKNL